MKTRKKPDFGYSWVWTYGHLVPVAVFALTAAASFNHGGPQWLSLIFGALAAWALAGFLVTQWKFRMNLLPKLPTQDYLPEGGRVLDIGCGAGRTSIMIAQARPTAEIVGLDNFSADYIEGHGPENTLRNFELVGIDSRARIERGICVRFHLRKESSTVWRVRPQLTILIRVRFRGYFARSIVSFERRVSFFSW